MIGTCSDRPLSFQRVMWERLAIVPDFTVLKHRLHEVKTRCSTPCHIDTTFVPLAPGKVLVNPDWVTELPECLRMWDVLVAPRPTYLPGSPIEPAEPVIPHQPVAPPPSGGAGDETGFPDAGGVPAWAVPHGDGGG